MISVIKKMELMKLEIRRISHPVLILIQPPFQIKKCPAAGGNHAKTRMTFSFLKELQMPLRKNGSHLMIFLTLRKGEGKIG